MAQNLLEDYLHKHGYSLTKARQLIFETLENQEPMSVKTLISRTPQIDRASVYRTLGLFETLGIIRRIQIGWKYKIELSETFNYHHHHITCNSCGTIVPLREDPTVEATMNALANEYGFVMNDHQLEIQGLCSRCKQKMTPVE